MSRSFLFLTSILFSVSVAMAQDDANLPCLHNDMELLRPLHQDDPAALLEMQLKDAELEHFTQNFQYDPNSRDGDPYIIPVVFHIIHDNGEENISDEQIEDAIRVLNDDFNRSNPDWESVHSQFLPLVADIGIEFRLARKDPLGNCTNGITRTQSTLTHAGDQNMKSLIQWPRNKYMNVWIAASANGAAGYTYRPASVANFPSGDGIVMLHNYTGSIGTSTPYRSRTLTHEVGHWLNLAHTWGNSNTPALASNCGDDDNVSDTPNTIGWTSCNVNGESCGSLDNVQNYMDYSYCGRMFTVGQAARMIAALNSGTAQRNQLWQNSTLVATGVLGEAELCAAAFTGIGGVICAGESISFKDVSFHNVSSRTWNFPGGSPETSSDPEPVVTYNEAGVYPVTLTVSDGSSTLTTTSVDHVTVLPSPGNAVPFYESFEDPTVVDGAQWLPVDHNSGNGFTVINGIAYTGGHSLRLLNGPSISGQIDEFLSGTFDLAGQEEIVISFRYAYARRAEGNDDKLRVYVSNDCGDSWTLRTQYRGISSLSTAPNTTSNFIPTSPDQWKLAEVSNISVEHYAVENFRFKFHFQSNGGNHLYIDDININGVAVSVSENGITSSEPAMVVPNPVVDQAQLVFSLDRSTRTRIGLLDVLGREIQVLQEATMPEGPHRMDLPMADLNSGMYFIRLEKDGVNEVVRFVVK